MNGNKTYIGLIVTFLPGLINDIGAVLAGPEDKFMKWVAIAGKVLVVVGAAHKVVKNVNGTAA